MATRAAQKPVQPSLKLDRGVEYNRVEVPDSPILHTARPKTIGLLAFVNRLLEHSSPNRQRNRCQPYV
ncbi:hypothetical protein IFO70_20590 [Phormidium tenue FACHB-886]|nr:hypothetical protein [Phormidium tenue FACHB-886]